MKIYSVKISKEKLQSASQAERSFFIIMAHLSNEINMLNRFLFWALDIQSESDADDEARVTMIFLFLRLLAGKLYEGNKLLEKKFYGGKLSKCYVPELPDEERELLDKIKKYFSGNNNVKHIRNNYAFHYSPEKLDSVLESVPEELKMYVSEKNVNTLFYFAEVLANYAILNSVEDVDGFEAYDKLVKELAIIARWFSKVSEALMIKFLSKHGDDIWDGVAEEVQFEKLPLIDDVQLPWFVNVSKNLNHGA